MSGRPSDLEVIEYALGRLPAFVYGGHNEIRTAHHVTAGENFRIAGLELVFLFFLGWRLNAPQDWPPISRYAAAGLIGACISVCNFSYSMWNEAFWASAALATAVILLQARHDGEAQA